VTFAEGNGLLLRGGTGGFRTGNPLWLMDAGYDELKSFLERKIEQDIDHFGGKVFSWGVFNEVVNDEETGFYNRQNKNPDDPNASPYAPYGWQYPPWVDGKDTSLIETRFFKARQVDPDAKLYLNEYANEEIGGEKAEFLYNLAAGMKKRGVLIDGAGFQLHLMFPRPAAGFAPDLENLDADLDRVDRDIKRYAAADLLVEFTEFECQIRLDDLDLGSQAGRDEHARRVRMQAEIYAGFMKPARENPNVASFTIWTVADKPHTSGFDSP
jgi:endo-1,4-beta-xylanase